MKIEWGIFTSLHSEHFVAVDPRLWTTLPKGCNCHMTKAKGREKVNDMILGTYVMNRNLQYVIQQPAACIGACRHIAQMIYICIRCNIYNVIVCKMSNIKCPCNQASQPLFRSNPSGVDLIKPVALCPSVRTSVLLSVHKKFSRFE